MPAWQVLRGDAVAEHQEAYGFHAQLASVLEVLDRNVCLGAGGGNTGYRCANFMGLVQIVDGSKPWQHQHGDLRLLGLVHRCLDQVQFWGQREAVVEGGSAQAIAVSTAVRESRESGAAELIGFLLETLAGMGKVPDSK